MKVQITVNSNKNDTEPHLIVPSRCWPAVESALQDSRFRWEKKPGAKGFDDVALFPLTDEKQDIQNCTHAEVDKSLSKMFTMCGIHATGDKESHTWTFDLNRFLSGYAQWRKKQEGRHPATG